MVRVFESMELGRLLGGTRALGRVRRALWGLALLATAAVTACNRDPLASGDRCTRSSECAIGLVCVEGACSASLAGIDDPGTVPMVMMGGEPMPTEGNADGGEVDPGAMTTAGSSGAGTSAPPAGSGGSGPTDAGALGMPDVEPGFQP